MMDTCDTKDGDFDIVCLLQVWVFSFFRFSYSDCCLLSIGFRCQDNKSLLQRGTIRMKHGPPKSTMSSHTGHVHFRTCTREHPSLTISRVLFFARLFSSTTFLRFFISPNLPIKFSFTTTTTNRENKHVRRVLLRAYPASQAPKTSSRGQLPHRVPLHPRHGEHLCHLHDTISQSVRHDM